MFTRILRGAAAGAAGTTALDAVTYADMAGRARPASETPQRTVAVIARRVGHPVEGDSDTRANRLTGLGALSGILTGVGVGAAVGLLRDAGLRPPIWAGSLLVGAVAMLVANAPMAGLRVSDPRTWSRTDWVADIVPHLAYGFTTYATLVTMDSE
ncbi:hypothetical protein B4N89_36220 [Embleya scabrispora]|uniref:DUF1440 domain-containing protein n=1 Tax=Embleya scabrispora TaxID=159449 RepID=A0A1T3NNV4_9ACTN|nr:hypothetical protein [Embleya scabrispora]OPC78438.1 hypothetical protein B4N89_36220 [Embleya scabrispora]